MDVLVVADGHYYQVPDGDVYADSVYDYNFYKRYLQAFDHVYAVVRVKHVDAPPAGKRLSSGPGVTFLLLPDYHGPYQYIKKYLQILKKVRSYSKMCECGIFRIPSATANIFCKYFLRLKKPFAVEVVTDPWENFGPRAEGNRLMLNIVRHSWTNLVREMCKKADGASYVTSRYLQGKYPPKYSKSPNASFASSYSSVELQDDKFASPRLWDGNQKKYIVSHVANYFSDYGKGHIVLIDAIKIVLDRGYDVEVWFVGDGPKREEFEKYAEKLGIKSKVKFLGRCACGDDVRQIMRSTDIFVLPTYAEGLPRALLEAMAESLPCLSSPVCGIPEIIEDDFLCDFDDAEGFAAKIEHFISNPTLMTQQGNRNLEVAKTFGAGVLNLRRKEFYMQLRSLVENQKFAKDVR